MNSNLCTSEKLANLSQLHLPLRNDTPAITHRKMVQMESLRKILNVITNSTNSAYRTVYEQQRNHRLEQVQTGHFSWVLEHGCGGVVTESLGGDSFQLYFLSKAFSLTYRQKAALTSSYDI